MSDQNDFTAQLRALMGNLQDVQTQAARLEARSHEVSAMGEAGGGLVRVTANAAGSLLAVKIDPKAVDPDDLGLLEDLIVVAANHAITGARDALATEVPALTGGMGFPFGGR